MKGSDMNKDTQTLLRLIAKAEVAKNHADEAQRLADLHARGVKAVAEASSQESM